MEFEKIIQLIETVSKSNLTKFTLEDDNMSISMETNKQAKMTVAPVMAPGSGPEPGTPGPYMESESNPKGPTVEFSSPGFNGNIVKSPLVGTFYNASSPDTECFVKAGDTVKKGQTLGIVEAMKLMNEIESEFDGTVEEILVNNEDVVEYGQPLFVIR